MAKNETRKTKESLGYLHYLRERDSLDDAALSMEVAHNSKPPVLEKGLLGPKEIKVGISSVLELKAELSRKETEVAKITASTPQIIPTATRFKGADSSVKLESVAGLGSKKAIQNKGIDARNAKDLSHPEHDEKSKLEASWLALQQKAKKYEQMQEDGYADDSEEILVDFLSKSMSDRNQSKKTRKDHLAPLSHQQTLKKRDWVQITDEFGRDRLVRAEDVQEMKSKIQNSDYIQMLKEQDEREKKDSLNDQKEDEKVAKDFIYPMESNPTLGYAKHFDSAREKRNLGVGFYQFAVGDDAKREEQMKEIKDLREETISTRNRLEIQKLKRKERTDSRMRILQNRAKKRKADEAEKSAEFFLDGLLSLDSCDVQD